MFYPQPPSPENQFLAPHIQLLNQSFERLLGYPLIKSNSDLLAQALFNAPFVLLSHNNADEPVLNYANLKGLELFELSWSQLTSCPSKQTAEQTLQSERETLLRQVTQQGFIQGYQGVRISRTGKRFLIKDAIVWNLNDAQGVFQGQAACFSNWEFL